MIQLSQIFTEVKLAAKFGGVSVVSTLIDVTVFWALTSAHLFPPAMANIPAYSCGIIVAFTLNRLLVFREAGDNTSVQFAKFVMTSLGGLVISTIAVGAMATVMSPILAKLFSLPLTFMWNFGLSRIWVFERARKGGRPQGTS